MLTPNTKHSKWDQEWQSHLQLLSSDLDQAKQTQTKTLLSEGEKLQVEKVNLTTEIRKFKQEQASLANIFAYHQEAQKELKRLNDHSSTHDGRQKNFLGTGTGTKWQGSGWLNQAQTHFVSSGGKLDNLYSVKIVTSTLETTEEQVLNLIARVVKALQKVDASDFTTKYNAKETDTVKQGQVATYLSEIQVQAAEVIVGSDKDSEGNAKQRSYDFASNYQKYDQSTNTWTPYNSPTFNFGNFFEFIQLTQNQPFLNDLDADKQKSIDKNQPWTIFLKGEAYSVDQLKDYGIITDKNKTTLYKTSETEKKTIPAGKGVQGWLDLAHSITQNSNNLTKLQAAFNSSPTQRLLSDLKTWTLENGFVTNGTYTLPESIDSLGVVISELETKKLNNVAEQALLARTISEKNKELKTKTDELKTKETSLNALIKEMIVKQRDQLKSYSVTNGFAGTNKRTESDLRQIRRLLLNIRYLENDGDATSLSSIATENTAYTQVETILDQVSRYGSQSYKVYLVDYFAELAFKMVGTKQEYDISQALSRVKAGKYTKDGKEHNLYATLDQFKNHFEEKDKLVKLTDWEKSAWEALKGDNQPEKLSDWQTKLKLFDPALETAFTSELMTKWQSEEANKFKTSSTLKELLESVKKEGKYESFFNHIKGGTNGYQDVKDLDTWGKLLLKDPKVVITTIKRYEYDHLEDTGEDKDKKKTQRERNIKLTLNKKGTYALTDAEINTALYEDAVGKKEISTKSLKADLTEYETAPNENPVKETSTLKDWFGFGSVGKSLLSYGLITAVVGGGIATWAFWDRIKTWWEPRNEEGETESENE